MRRPPTGCRIVERDTGGKNSVAFDVFCGKGRPWWSVPPPSTAKGSIDIYRLGRKRAGTLWNVAHIWVAPGLRRRGVATALYEAAAAYACKRRGKLASTQRDPEAGSTLFWQKQERKGRARSYRYAGYPSRVYVLDVCDRGEIDLSGLRSR